MNRQFLDPALRGSYPEEMTDIFGEAWPKWPAEDMKLIRQPLDFIGVNYYTRNVARADEANWPLRVKPVRQPQKTYTETGWEVYPKGLTDTLVWVKQRYGDIPVYVTENGAAFFDPPTVEDGKVEDPLRMSYLRQHIGAVRDAIRQGVDIRGYFVWSLLDNFEWALGYSKRFGIVHVDYATLERTLKASAHYYAQVIESHGALIPG
jgi:beta-glucosidase